ncbi:MAG TPA: carboxypeptidase-like regulatory domain-containing protein [Candidatus Acidoferrales bacterium]|nr:carboxypeptidase-like regulatory domain-containing protein [Candidatus Acidoferrales bacterium]
MKGTRVLLVCLVAALTFAAGATRLIAQTSNTGALSGTVTDPSGGVIVGATVTATNLATGQTRTATTSSTGSYQISLLPPGNYSVRFDAAGFKSLDVPSITINVTETPELNRKLEVGSSSEKVTVEAHAENLQTENATNGSVVGSQEIQALPLVTRNYTQIVDLSPGVVTNVANATAMGNGTQNVSANGQGGISNSYSMDGANITQYTSGGAAQMGSMPGIAIPNPDTIQEFKVQTSQYDAGYGRNAGANVEVITKGGSNNFHGDLFEFNRNNMFNANDFFYKFSELSNHQANAPQTLKENTFGGTLGGPIKKNKIFFFGSYQGFRQLNGIATNGFATGFESAATLMPWNDYADFQSGACSDLRCSNNIPAYRAYLGSVFGPGAGVCPAAPNAFGVPAGNCNTGWADGVTVANDGSNITNTAIALLQSKGATKAGYNQGGYWIAAAPQNCTLEVTGLASSGCRTAISLPTQANENQYMANSDWNITPRNTLQERYLYQSDPEIQSFDCLFTGDCNPGSPADVKYLSHTGTIRLTSTITNSLINEARFTFQRNLEDATDPNPLMSCNLANGGTIIPLNNNGQPCSANVTLPIKDFGIVPSIDVLNLYSPSGDWNQGGNFAGTGTNIDNEFQVGDQISWNHGIHSIRFGFDAEWDQYNNTTPASGRGEVLFDNTADFLTSSSGPVIDGTPQTGLPPSGGVPAPGCGFFGGSNCAGGAAPIALRGLLTHYNRIGAFDGFVQDDIKVNRKLTVNVGLRWEYDGWPSDKIGQFTNIWTSQLALENTGSFYLNQPLTCQLDAPTGPFLPVGTLAGFVVPNNVDPAAGLTGPCGVSGVKKTGTNTLFSGSPLDNFMPRLGVAWQPFGNKLVVRAGYGWFYDRAGSIFLVDNVLNLPPYGGTINGTSISNLENTLHTPFQSVVGIPLTWTPRYLSTCETTGASPTCTGQYNLNAYNPTGALNYSALGFTANSNTMSQRLPLTQLYNLDFQYDLGHGWVADVGYVGSHSIHVLTQGTPTNVAHLVGPASSVLCGGVTGDCQPQDLTMLKNPNFPGGNPIPFNDAANTTPITVNTTQNLPARVSYLGYTAAALTTTNTLGDAKYNSLQAQLRHNFSNGMLLQASYTWSKNLTNVNAAESGELDTGQTDFGTSGLNNPLDYAQQYGPYSGERSQRLIVSYSYDLPWKSTEGLSGKLLSGWTLSGITTIQNGQPFTVTDAGGGTIYGASTSRALLSSAFTGRCGSNGVCQPNKSVATSGSTTARVLAGLPGSPTYVAGSPTAGWINGNAFTSFASLTTTSPYCIGGVPNPTGTATSTCGAVPFFSPGATYLVAGTGWGNSPVGIITGPGQWNWDMSLQKNTKITEWGTLQFRAEFYNIWNHPQFSNPLTTGFTAAGFGEIDSTSVSPRVIQFGLKFLF